MHTQNKTVDEYLLILTLLLYFGGGGHLSGWRVASERIFQNIYIATFFATN
jgi:hypothetical protein